MFIGYTKFDNDPGGEWVQIFEQIGLGQWFRYFTGVTQIVGAVLMLTRRTRTIGAAMLACTMVGAMIVDVFVAHSPGFALVPLILWVALSQRGSQERTDRVKERLRRAAFRAPRSGWSRH